MKLDAISLAPTVPTGDLFPNTFAVSQVWLLSHFLEKLRSKPKAKVPQNAR
jgi:hypothetical protein